MQGNVAYIRTKVARHYVSGSYGLPLFNGIGEDTDKARLDNWTPGLLRDSHKEYSPFLVDIKIYIYSDSIYFVSPKNSKLVAHTSINIPRASRYQKNSEYKTSETR
jgi:hypothetical protein